MNTSIEITLAEGVAERLTDTTSRSPFLPDCAGGGENFTAADASGSATPMRRASKRLAREWRTIETMVRIYCRDHHERALCPECRGLLDYASVRLDRCRFGTQKPTCAKCPVHCYQKKRREQVRMVMRYAGARMLLEHPVLSLWHWVDGIRFFKESSAWQGG